MKLSDQTQTRRHPEERDMDVTIREIEYDTKRAAQAGTRILMRQGWQLGGVDETTITMWKLSFRKDRGMEQAA